MARSAGSVRLSLGRRAIVLVTMLLAGSLTLTACESKTVEDEAENTQESAAGAEKAPEGTSDESQQPEGTNEKGTEPSENPREPTDETVGDADGGAKEADDPMANVEVYEEGPLKGLPKVPEPELPEFEDPPEGERAAIKTGLGYEAGVTTLADVEAKALKAGFTCRNTSTRAMFIAIHDQYASGKLEAGEGGPHGTPSKKLDEGEGMSDEEKKNMAVLGGKAHGNIVEMAKNPQVRLSCEDVQASDLGDRDRADTKGRWLFIFDSPELPLRHTSYTRTYRGADKHQKAIADATATVEAFQKVYGEPTETKGELPQGGEVPKFKAITHTWEWTDFRVQVKMQNLGQSGIIVDERIEVPTPIKVTAATASEGAGGDAQTDEPPKEDGPTEEKAE